MGWRGPHWRGAPDHLHRIPTASWLALVGAGLALVLTVRTAFGSDAGTIIGGVLAFVVPYVAIAVALYWNAVWARGLGVALAALMTWLPSFGVQEFVSSLWHASPPQPMAATFFALTLIGLAVVAFGFRDLVRAARAMRYWSQTPAAARTAFLAGGYLALVFVADTYTSANPPLSRMLLVPLLLVANLASAYMLRAPNAVAQVTGLLLTGAGAAATIGYWAARPGYFTLVERLSATPEFGYSTMLPWPVLLSLFLLLEAAIVVTGVRRLVQRPAGTVPAPAD